MKATGYTCDWKECGKFIVGDTIPTGWITLRVQLPAVEKGNGMLELCSNKCLALLSLARAEADGVSFKKIRRPAPQRTDEQKEAARLNALRTTHLVHHERKGVVSDSCEFCEPAAVPA